MPDYVDNAELLSEWKKSYERHINNPSWSPDQYLTRRFVRLIMKMVDNIALGPRYAGYGSNYVDDMKGYALLTVTKYAMRFDPAKSTNAFSYFTMTIMRAFNRSLKKEVTQAKVIDALETRMNVGAFTDPEESGLGETDDEINYDLAA